MFHFFKDPQGKLNIAEFPQEPEPPTPNRKIQLNNCDHCGSLNDPNWKLCQYCGAPNTYSQTQKEFDKEDQWKPDKNLIMKISM